MNKPYQIYNVDESGVPLDHQLLYVLTKKSQKSQVCFVQKQGTNYCSWVYQCIKTSYTSFYCMEGYFPEVQIFPTREPVPIQKFPSSTLNQTHMSNFLAPVNAK